MMLVLIQRVYIYALWLIFTCGLLLVTVNSDLVCPDGWHEHNTQCYWFSDFNTTRATAMSECVTRNGSLVTVSNSSVNTFLETHLLYDTKYWIGLKLVNLQPHAWRWTNGSGINSYHEFDWCGDVVTPSTACGGVLYTSIRDNCLTDVRCAQDTHQFICEKEWSSADDCPSTSLGFGTKVWYIEIKYCYYVRSEMLNSADAARFCWQNGARLFTIKHAEDSNFLKDTAPGKGTLFWVGISPYRWDDGTPYTWHNWDDNGPSIGGHCTLLQENGTWRYGVCADSNNLICQTDATEVPVPLCPFEKCVTLEIPCNIVTTSSTFNDDNMTSRLLQSDYTLPDNTAPEDDYAIPNPTKGETSSDATIDGARVKTTYTTDSGTTVCSPTADGNNTTKILLIVIGVMSLIIVCLTVSLIGITVYFKRQLPSRHISAQQSTPYEDIATIAYDHINTSVDVGNRNRTPVQINSNLAETIPKHVSGVNYEQLVKVPKSSDVQHESQAPYATLE